jgi:ActR/RegA family two-component response regulator
MAKRSQNMDGIAQLLNAQLGDLRLEARLRDHISFVLGLCDGNLTLTADLLGLHRRTLQRILRRVARGKAPGGARYKKGRRPKDR